MLASVRVVVDHLNGDGLAEELSSSPDLLAACPQSGETSHWLFFGSAKAAEDLHYYATELHGGDAVVYRFPLASLPRKTFLLHVLAMALGHKREDVKPVEIMGSSEAAPVATPSRAIAWLGSVVAGLSEGRLYDVFTALSQFRDLGLKGELGDLAAPVSVVAVLFSRIVQVELELLHAASRKHDLVLAEQLISEGYFRTLTMGNIIAIRADLARPGRFVRRLELFDVLEPTRRAFLNEVARHNYGLNTHRVFLIQTTFYAKCAADELAMRRPSEAFALVFKGFECLALWENLANGGAYFYDHRVLRTDHTRFEGVGAAWGNSRGTLINRVNAASYRAVEDMIETRNVSRIGHGLSVVSPAVVAQHLALLTQYVAATAPVRGVGDYYTLLEDAWVISGFCETLSRAMGEHFLKDHRLTMGT